MLPCSSKVLCAPIRLPEKGFLAALQDLNKESKRIARYRARMEAVDKWMGRRHLPKSLRARIGHHYQEVQSLSSPSIMQQQQRGALRSSFHESWRTD